MARKLLAVFSMGLITAVFTGCAADQAIFRGQSPMGGCTSGAPGGTWGTGGSCDSGACMNGAGCQTGMCGPMAGGMMAGGAGCPNGMCGPMAGGAGCQNGMCGPMAAGGGMYGPRVGGAGCRNGLCGGNPYSHFNLPFHPVHRNYVNYQAPRNLQYPNPNQPNALVQYPYYTLRGPTDFFYTGE